MVAARAERPTVARPIVISPSPRPSNRNATGCLPRTQRSWRSAQPKFLPIFRSNERDGISTASVLRPKGRKRPKPRSSRHVNAGLEKDEPQRSRLVGRKQGYRGDATGALGMDGKEWRCQRFVPFLLDRGHFDPCCEYRSRRGNESAKEYERCGGQALEDQILHCGSTSSRRFPARLSADAQTRSRHGHKRRRLRLSAGRVLRPRGRRRIRVSSAPEPGALALF